MALITMLICIVVVVQAVVHGMIGLSCGVVDGETHRGKLMAPGSKPLKKLDRFIKYHIFLIILKQ